MKQVLLLAVLLAAYLPIHAQDGEEKKKEVNVKFGGFFKYDAWLDTRQNVEALDGLLAMYPKNKLYDNLGRDINAESSVNMTAISTRLNANITGPDVFNAKTSTFIEVDFTGMSQSIYHFRFRHAYAKMSWTNTQLLMGRYWHPLFAVECFPDVMSLNTGVPFQVFNRSPQVSLTHSLGKFKILGAAIYQSDYKSDGPAGKTVDYIRNAKVPNLHLQINHKTEKTLIGVAADYKVLKPYLFTQSLYNTDAIYKSSETIESVALMAYIKLNINKFCFKAKAMYGQNMYEHLLPGGYGVSSVDSLTGARKFANLNNTYYWSNITYGKKLKGGLMCGYMKNLGSDANIVGEVYARGIDIDQIYRISPHILYKKEKMQFSVEVEHTLVKYGTVDFADKAKVKSTSGINNTRVLLTAMYFF